MKYSIPARHSFSFAIPPPQISVPCYVFRVLRVVVSHLPNSETKTLFDMRSLKSLIKRKLIYHIKLISPVRTDKIKLHSTYLNGGRDSVVGSRLTASWTIQGSNRGVGEIFCARPNRPRGPRILPFNDYRVFLGVKRPERIVDHSPPSSAEVVNWLELYCTSAFPPCLHRHTVGVTFTFHTSMMVKDIVYFMECKTFMSTHLGLCMFKASLCFWVLVTRLKVACVLHISYVKYMC
jgi:hypothetical protein